jgi:multiple sugar transport system ATP-binding protein
MAGLSVKEISKSFDGTRVLDRVSLELSEGELLVLLGPSGCGKSTLLRIIAGIEEADSGEIHLGGKRVDQLRPKDRNVALVFQNYSLYPHMSVEKNLGFPLSVAKTPKAEIAARVKEIAAMLGLSDRLSDRPAQLSGGQRQRVALGRAIIRKPSIFLLDEPLSNLDADLRVRMRQEIVKLQRQVGVAMVHVTHDQTEALTMADRVALLHKGRIEQIGTPEELYRAPATLNVAQFVGQPKINAIVSQVDGAIVAAGYRAWRSGTGSRRERPPLAEGDYRNPPGGD